MTVLWLRLQAPFAAFRWLQAGVYRATSPVIPPSAAWGLVLNLAHIETRAHSEKHPVTGIRADAPLLRIAVGACCESSRAVLYQQLHSYPVGSSGKELARRTYGAKYWIAPVRREILVDFDCQLGIRAADSQLLERVALGLTGQLGENRYGLPFAGDNSLLFSRIDILDEPVAARWYARLQPDEEPRPGSCRLTVAIDRHNSAATSSPLFAPTEPQAEPPESGWTWCPRDPDDRP